MFENSNILMQTFNKLIAEAPLSDEEDRKLFLDLAERGWANTEKSEQRNHLQRKVDTTCVNDLQAWIEKGFGPQPKNFLNHGLEQQLEIIFKVI